MLPAIASLHARESNVGFYCRCFPDVFTEAKGAILRAESGREYLDFFCGAGVLNFGHNNEFIKERLLHYIQGDGIVQALDMHTAAKIEFLRRFEAAILRPRELDYKLQFCAPSGAAAVSAALKLAIKIQGRSKIVAFMGGYHGLTLDVIGTTSRRMHRRWNADGMVSADFVPYPGRFGSQLDTIQFIECLLEDDSSGTEKPAAILLETIQAEGGVFVAPVDWLKRLAAMCRRHNVLLICDDIQVGCHRSGPYFSWERAAVVPDMVILSKALSGYGLPMALLLLRPDLDQWLPGEDAGTFRGNQLAFTAASATLELMSASDQETGVTRRGELVARRMEAGLAGLDERIRFRGLGLIWGIDLSGLGQPDLARRISRACFDRGLLIECCGPQANVLKMLPPLDIDERRLRTGCDMILASVESELQSDTEARPE